MAFPSTSEMVGIGIVGVFCVAIAIHARSYLAKFGTVTSGPAQLDGYSLGGDGGGYGDAGGHGACGDSGGGDGGCDGGH